MRPVPQTTESHDDNQARLQTLRERLVEAIPEPRCELAFESPWQLLIATILSAQSTDRTVNRVTPRLFEAYPTPASLAAAPREEVEGLIKSTGFFRNKAKAIQGASRVLVDEHGGEVPADMKALIQLPGVARKTANVVLGTAFGIPAGFPIDTHAKRVSGRLGLTLETKPDKIERDLCERFPQETWIDSGHRLILHGRYVCTARAPRCAQCPLNEVCPASEVEPKEAWTRRALEEASLVQSEGRIARGET